MQEHIYIDSQLHRMREEIEKEKNVAKEKINKDYDWAIQKLLEEKNRFIQKIEESHNHYKANLDNPNVDKYLIKVNGGVQHRKVDGTVLLFCPQIVKKKLPTYTSDTESSVVFLTQQPGGQAGLVGGRPGERSGGLVDANYNDAIYWRDPLPEMSALPHHLIAADNVETGGDVAASEDPPISQKTVHKKELPIRTYQSTVLGLFER